MIPIESQLYIHVVLCTLSCPREHVVVDAHIETIVVSLLPLSLLTRRRLFSLLLVVSSRQLHSLERGEAAPVLYCRLKLAVLTALFNIEIKINVII